MKIIRVSETKRTSEVVFLVRIAENFSSHIPAEAFITNAPNPAFA